MTPAEASPVSFQLYNTPFISLSLSPERLIGSMLVFKFMSEVAVKDVADTVENVTALLVFKVWFAPGPAGPCGPVAPVDPVDPVLPVLPLLPLLY